MKKTYAVVVSGILLLIGMTTFLINQDNSKSLQSERKSSATPPQPANALPNPGASPTDHYKKHKIFSDKGDVYQVAYSMNASQESDDSDGQGPLYNISLSTNLHTHLKIENNKNIVFLDPEQVSLSLALGESTADSENLFPIENAIDIPFALELKDSGEIANIIFQFGETDFSANIKRAISSRLQFIKDNNNKGSWTIDESNESGVAKTTYSTKGNNAYKKVIDYIDVAKSQGALISTITASDRKTTYSFDTIKAVNIISTENQVTAYLGANIENQTFTEVRISWEAELQRNISFEIGSGLTHLAINQIPSFDSTSDTASQKKYAKTIKVKDFLNAIDGLDINQDSNKIWKVRDHLLYSILKNPDDAYGLASAITNKIKGDDASLLLGILADAGTAESQKSILDTASNASLSVELREHALSHLNFIEKPTAETVDTLKDLSQSAVEPLIKETATLALGSSIRNGLNNSKASSTDLNVMDSAQGYLENALGQAPDDNTKRLVALALGNSGQETSRSQLLDLAYSDSESDRALGVDSLRFDSSPEASSVVNELMKNDPSIDVRQSAINSTLYRDPSLKTDQVLFQLATTDQDHRIRMSALEAIKVRGLDSQESRNIIADVNVNDPSEEVRNFAARLLGN